MKYIHFSIDDVGKSLAWLSVNRPKSIFDMRFFGLLKKWHETYSIKVTLNVIACFDNFLLTEIPEAYKSDFSASADWMKYAYHSKSLRPFIEDSLDAVVAGYNLYDEACGKLGWRQSDIARLHYWLASEEQKDFLRSKGISTLINKDENREYEYDINDEYHDQGITYWKNNIRFETDEMDKIFEEINSKKRVVMFTHEWALFDQESKIENTLKLLSDNECRYI